MNLGQLRTALQTLGYGTDTASAQTESLNRAYRELAGEHQWPWLEAQSTTVTATPGTPDYTLTTISSTLLHVQAVRIEIGTDQPTIEYLDEQEFRDLEHDDRDRGVPIYWTRIRESIRLWPAPDRAYKLTVDYVIRPVALTADVDTPIFDSQYHDVLVWGAAKDMAFRQRDWGARAVADQEFQRRKIAMEQAYGLRQRQSSNRVKRSAFWRNVGRTWSGWA